MPAATERPPRSQPFGTRGHRGEEHQGVAERPNRHRRGTPVNRCTRGVERHDQRATHDRRSASDPSSRRWRPRRWPATIARCPTQSPSIDSATSCGDRRRRLPAESSSPLDSADQNRPESRVRRSRSGGPTTVEHQLHNHTGHEQAGRQRHKSTRTGGAAVRTRRRAPLRHRRVADRRGGSRSTVAVDRARRRGGGSSRAGRSPHRLAPMRSPAPSCRTRRMYRAAPATGALADWCSWTHRDDLRDGRGASPQRPTATASRTCTTGGTPPTGPPLAAVDLHLRTRRGRRTGPRARGRAPAGWPSRWPSGVIRWWGWTASHRDARPTRRQRGPSPAGRDRDHRRRSRRPRHLARRAVLGRGRRVQPGVQPHRPRGQQASLFAAARQRARPRRAPGRRDVRCPHRPTTESGTWRCAR